MPLVVKIRSIFIYSTIRLQLDTLELRHVRADLILVYKMMQGLSTINVPDFFRRTHRSTTLDTRSHPYKIYPVAPSIDEPTRNGFANRIYLIWNSLPCDVVISPTLSTFKARLDKIDLSSFYDSKI